MAIAAARRTNSLPQIRRPDRDDSHPVVIFIDTEKVSAPGDLSFLLSTKITKEYRRFIAERMELTCTRALPRKKKTSYIDAYYQLKHAKHLLYLDVLDSLKGLLDCVDRSGKKALVVIKNTWSENFTVDELRDRVYAETPFGKYIYGKTDGSETEWLEKQGLRRTPHVVIDQERLTMGDAALLFLELCPPK